MNPYSSGLVAADMALAVPTPSPANWPAVLDDLQGNILKGHGRPHAAYLFLTFVDPSAAPGVLASQVRPLVTSASRQLLETERYRELGIPGGTYVGYFISAAGFAALQGEVPDMLSDGSYRAGAAASAPVLGDAFPEGYELPYVAPPHAMLIVADSITANVVALIAHLQQRLAPAISIYHVQWGEALRNSEGEGIEHFGYVDGRSQPLFLEQDVIAETYDTDGVSNWNPAFPFSLVGVPYPTDANLNAHGSYFVFRKLEQNVKAFKEAEEGLARVLGSPTGSELAGAQLVGRFEDGSPVARFNEEGASHPVPNNFAYTDDHAPGSGMPAMKCPFHAHIRKTNPRGSSPGGEAEERTHLMARRGIPYEENGARRPRDEHGLFRMEDPTQGEQMPSKDVGLLFGAYMASIQNQFEFTQLRWANNPNFPVPGTGVDPVIGPAGQASPLTCPVAWGGSTPRTKSAVFGGHVTPKGMAYFFAPPISGIG